MGEGEPDSSYPRGKATSGYGSALPVKQGLVVDFYRMKQLLRIDPESLTATFPEREIASANLTARLTGRSTAGEPVDETRELECVLRKIDKQWLFSRIEVIEVLKK